MTAVIASSHPARMRTVTVRESSRTVPSGVVTL